MINNLETLKGVVHGKTIELEHSLNMPDGAEIEIVVKTQVLNAEQHKAQLRELFGSCAEDAADLDQYLQRNREHRRFNRSELE